MAGSGLQRFRCVMVVDGRRSIIDCLAPSALAAGHVLSGRVFEEGTAPWVQVLASQWNATIGEFLKPVDLTFGRGDSLPPGTDLVVVCGEADREGLQ